MSNDKSIKFWDVSGTPTQVHSIDNAHPANITSLAYHNNNKRLLASGSLDNKIKIWNTVTYALVATLAGHTNPVRSLDFDPSRQGELASGAGDNTVKIWDLNGADPSDTTTPVTTLIGHPDKIFAVAFETSGLLASGDNSGFLIIWETSRVVKWNISTASFVRSLAFSPLADLLASGHSINNIKLWTPSTGIQFGSLVGHGNTVASLAFKQNGLLASGSWDRTIKFWNVETEAESKTLSGHTNQVRSVAFRSDGLLASGSDDTNVRIWY